MKGRSTFLPVLLVVIIGLLTLIAITTGRTNAPDVTADAGFPQYICTFNSYCAGETCTNEPQSFVIYTAYDDGLPRLEAPRFGPRITLVEEADRRLYVASGGAIEGTFTLLNNRAIDFAGESKADGTVEEHYGMGRCDRLRGS